MPGVEKNPLHSINIVKSFIFEQVSFCLFLRLEKMVVVAQLVRASDCGSEGRGFEPHQPPEKPRNQFGDFI